MNSEQTRRQILLMGVSMSAIILAGCSVKESILATRTQTVPLPSPDDIRHDYQRMVDFGPRLPGHPNHIRFVDSLASDFKEIGLTLGPCIQYKYKRWDPLNFGLEIETNSGIQSLPKLSYYVRSKPTSPSGVSGQLFYGGEITAGGPTNLGIIPKGSIVVLDGKLPKMTIRELVNIEYLHMPDDEKEAYLDRPYKRLWLTPAFNLDELFEKGAAGVVIIMDVSSDMIENNYSPHSATYHPPLPALFVGQDTGEDLRKQAKQGLPARLTLEAEWVDCNVPTITATLPGESDEVLIIDTHTDGQNFIEENGAVAMVQLARHFASLPEEKKLKRTLVFAAWAGHMSGALPECKGWIQSHGELVDRAAAAITIEHLGAPEWEDIPGTGYGPTGRNEYMNFASTKGVISNLVKAGLQKFDLGQHGIEPGPGTTTGAVFHDTGVPHLGIICGPNYLLGIVENGHMDKLDAELASRQTHMIAELIKKIDSIPKATLRAEDDSLGASPVTGLSPGIQKECPA